MPHRPPVLYVAGTQQHSGKTVVSLGLTMVLAEEGLDVRYMKPVGQRTVNMGEDVVDEDVALLIETCDLPIKPQDASPVTLPSGFTRRFLDTNGDTTKLKDRIADAFEHVREGADVVIVEGTGHAGVGSVVGLGNAKVASMLGAEVITVTGGGIGRPIDEYCLNQAAFARESVPIFGFICNKVIPDKLEYVRPYIEKWAENHDVTLLGLIPYEPLLAETTVRQIARECGAQVVGGGDHLDCLIEKVIVGAEPAHRFLDYLGPGVLALIPGDRDDLVLTTVSAQKVDKEGQRCSPAGICLTSGIKPHPAVMKVAQEAGLPILAVESGMFDAASKISQVVAKMSSNEKDKIQRAYQLVENHLDLGQLWERLGL